MIYLSNSTVVTLRNVQKELTGFYGCEVSADAPLFHTGIMSAPVIVTEEPASLPDLSVEKGKYSLGEKIRANCTSQGGYPPANLTWYINGKEVHQNQAGIASVDELKQRIIDACNSVKVESISLAVKDNWQERACLCISNGGDQFKHDL
uniref:Ig-like domain-containing protein n=1 Tax=Rhodnius prolixus TaxID=13249 RepID=T1HIL0_RHOPR